MLSEDTRVYLVKVDISLLGGGCLSAIDAIEASSSAEATRVAVNSLILAGDNAVSFGETIIFPGVVASASAEALGVIDLSEEDNKCWLYSVEAWKDFERNLEQGVKKKSRKEAPVFNEEPPR